MNSNKTNCNSLCDLALTLGGNRFADNAYDEAGLVYGIEQGIDECKAEIQGEEARFGDAGPGAWCRVWDAQRELAAERRKLEWALDGLGLAGRRPIPRR